ncbi:hypothetical protein Droror1_Dr00001153 [Drosera rotundifolia]
MFKHILMKSHVQFGLIRRHFAGPREANPPCIDCIELRASGRAFTPRIAADLFAPGRSFVLFHTGETKACRGADLGPQGRGAEISSWALASRPGSSAFSVGRA